MLRRFPVKIWTVSVVLDLILETKQDWWEVEALFDLCFAPGREALSSYRLRDNTDPVFELCYIMRDREGILGGAIRFWPVQVSGYPVLLLGPVAVHPTRQGEGLGEVLIRESLKRASDLGWTHVILVGDAPYYRRFGFSRLQHIEIPPPVSPARVLGLALDEGGWEGLTGRVEQLLLYL